MTNEPKTPDPFQAMGGGVFNPATGNWLPQGHPEIATMAPKPPAAPGAGGTTGAAGPSPTPANSAIQSPSTAGAQIQPGAQTSVAGAFQQALVNQLAPGPLTTSSPEVAPAIAANRASEQRGMERGRAQLAEQAAGQGIDPNGFGSQLRGLQAESALRQGQFEGGAMMQAGQQRAQQLQSALALSGGLLGDQDRMTLQRELAQLQAQLSREGLNVQSSLGQGDLDLRSQLGNGQLNLGLLNALLGNQQFGQNLSGQLGMFNSSQNQNALLSLLGGL